MNPKLNIIFSAFGHLPSGTGEVKFEALYNKEIKPLIAALDKYPKINMVLYYSGVIFNWIERRHPEFFMLLEDLLNRKQAELLGGGFYNPMLSLLPPADRIGQIEMLTTYLRKQFGKRLSGCWLPSAAWEQSLVSSLNSCGMNYTFLDDWLFPGLENSILECSNLEPDPFTGELFSPCITEDQGKLITVFPIAFSLARKLKTDDLFNLLKELSEKLPQSGDDKTIVIPIEGGQCEELFEKLSNSNLRIKSAVPSKIFKALNSLKKNYFTYVGKTETTETGTVRMGTIPVTNPRQFLAKHPAAGGIYAKMIYVHTLINNQLRGDKTRKRTAMEELWKAQDSNLYRLGSENNPGLFPDPKRYRLES